VSWSTNSLSGISWPQQWGIMSTWWTFTPKTMFLLTWGCSLVVYSKTS